MVEDEDADTIHEDALSVQVRSGWVTVGEPLTPEEYEILLCTGGPACRIIGTLNDYGEPETARLQHQDWFTPWQDYTDAEEEILLTYARHFYFSY